MTNHNTIELNNQLSQLHRRVEDLEMKLSFQDDTIESLNNALSQQQVQLMLQQEQLKMLAEKIQSQKPSEPTISLADEKPPHY